MFCDHCGVQNRERASYCLACGKRLERKRENQTQTRQSQPFPSAARPQHLRYGPLLSRRTVLIGGAALTGALLLQVAGCGSSSLSSTPGTSGPTPSTSTSVSSLSSSSHQHQPFHHVALGTLLVKYQGHYDSLLTIDLSFSRSRITTCRWHVYP